VLSMETQGQRHTIALNHQKSLATHCWL